MKLRSLFAIALVFVFSTAALAQNKSEKRTLIIKDGKVITDTIEGTDDLPGLFKFDGELFGGKRAFLGVSLVDLTPELREYFGTAKDSGVLVGSLEDNGPAEKAGVRVGDIITSVDGKEIASTFELRKALKDKKGGETVRLDVLRGHSRQTIVATVVEKEMPGIPRLAELEALRREPGEWRTRVTTLPNCSELQAKINALEAKMKELERKLQK
jgi:membrane-associated protease RseP (regulator of RpoE activity)